MANVCINHLTIENYLENVLESEINPLNTKLVVNPESLSADTQNTGDTHLNLQVRLLIKLLENIFSSNFSQVSIVFKANLHLFLFFFFLCL